MSWRPENWEETTFHLGFNTPYKCASKELGVFGDGVEAGADAMLEALKKDGVFTYGHHTPDIDLGDAPEVSGYWVFTPEEEV